MSISNTKSIGSFVFLALLLLVGALLVFTTQDLFKDKFRFAIYFTQSVKGLNVGAPVTFRGVQIGEVVDISIVVIDEPNGNRTIRPRIVVEGVTGATEVARIALQGAKVPKEVANDRLVTITTRKLIDSGMRASLKLQSFLTGQLYVSLNFNPSVPERYLADEYEPLEEIPSIDMSLDTLLAKLENLPFEEIVIQLLDTLQSIDALADNSDLLDSFTNAKNLLADLDQTVNNLDALLQKDGQRLLRNTNQTMVTANSLLANQTKRAINEFSGAMTEANKTLQTLRAVSSEDSALNNNLMRTLDDFSDAARSLRDLADFLEQHPESILQGRP